MLTVAFILILLLIDASTNVCTLCLEDLNIASNSVKKTSCGHTFHSKCFLNLIEHGIDRCPNCRKEDIIPETAKTYIPDIFHQETSEVFLRRSEQFHRDMQQVIQNINEQTRNLSRLLASTQMIYVQHRNTLSRENRNQAERIRQFDSHRTRENVHQRQASSLHQHEVDRTFRRRTPRSFLGPIITDYIFPDLQTHENNMALHQGRHGLIIPQSDNAAGIRSSLSVSVVDITMCDQLKTGFLQTNSFRARGTSVSSQRHVSSRKSVSQRYLNRDKVSPYPQSLSKHSQVNEHGVLRKSNIVFPKKLDSRNLNVIDDDLNVVQVGENRRQPICNGIRNHRSSVTPIASSLTRSLISRSRSNYHSTRRYKNIVWRKPLQDKKNQIFSHELGFV